MNRQVIFNGRSLTIKLFAITLFVFGYVTLCFAQEGKIDIDALTQETQQSGKNADDMSFVWWLPEEFWRVSFEQDPLMTQPQIEEILKVLRPYIFVAVVEGKIGPLGGATFKPRESIQNNIKVVDSGGSLYGPLSDDKIDADTKNFLSVMQPLFENMLGQLGENINMFVFPSKDKNGHDIAVATNEGSFSVKLGESEYKWRLPLASLLPLKTCSVDGEKLNGAWKFCPWHGVALE